MCQCAFTLSSWILANVSVGNSFVFMVVLGAEINLRAKVQEKFRLWSPQMLHQDNTEQ